MITVTVKAGYIQGKVFFLSENLWSWKKTVENCSQTYTEFCCTKSDSESYVYWTVHHCDS